MKILIITMMKGGSGKSFISAQLARYYRKIKNKRVLIIDLDDQGNCTESLERDGFAIRLKQTISNIMCNFDVKLFNLEDLPEVAIVADDSYLTTAVVEQARNKNEDGIEYGKISDDNFKEFLKSVSPKYDLCIIDCPANNDVRMTITMGIANAVLSPILLTQENLKGMRLLLNGSRGLNVIKNKLNNELEFLGFLPNLVEKNEKQINAFNSIADSPFGKFLFADKYGELLSIPKRNSISEVQGRGQFIGDFAKVNSSAREAYRKIKIVFEEIIERIENNNEENK